ncbi:MAG: potassium channel family protein [Phycisphaerae bacterium]
MQAQTRLLAALFALVTVFLAGTIGYMAIDQVGFRAASYQTLITISTVGYSEQWDLSRGAHMWTSAIIVFGILVVTVAFASLQAMIVGGELRGVLGRRKLKDRIGKLSGHFIVCGYGRMGSLISRDLGGKGKKVVVIDRDEKRTAAVGEDGFDYVLGDASDEDILREARIERAAGLVTVLRGDADNVFVALIARGMRQDMPIIARGEYLDSESKLKRAGATQVICPQAIGANRAVNLLARPAIASLVDITMGDEEWEIEEVRVQPGSRLMGRSLRDLNLREKAKIMVVAVHSADGETTINPGPEHSIQADDVMVVIGPAGSADTLADLTN